MNQRKIWQNESEIGYAQLSQEKRSTGKINYLKAAQEEKTVPSVGSATWEPVQCCGVEFLCEFYVQCK